jgi:hypothetical protein
VQPQQILLVDDDAGAIQLLGGLLANVAALRFATNGKDALRLGRWRRRWYRPAAARRTSWLVTTARRS